MPEVIVVKFIRGHKVDPNNIAKIELTDEVKEAIRKSGVKSLQGLVGPNAKEALFRQAESYWGE